jgi:hypothetical protein
LGDLGNFNDIMLFFMLFAAVYLLYYAFRGEGKIYENDYPKAMQEEHRNYMRKFCWIVGIGILVFTALEFFNPNNGFFSWLNIGFVLGAVVVYLIIFRKKFGKYVYPKKPEK